MPKEPLPIAPNAKIVPEFSLRMSLNNRFEDSAEKKRLIIIWKSKKPESHFAVTAGITEHKVGSIKRNGPVGSLKKCLLQIIV